MIERAVSFSLKQKGLILFLLAIIVAWGVYSFMTIPIDALPDVSNIQVEVVSTSPGLAPFEIERFVTYPLEMAMRGLPGLVLMRSVTKFGLSIVTVVFKDNVDIYFARQLVMERLLEVGSRLPQGITPVLGPVSTGLGEVYQYTLERPDDGDRTLSEDELMQRRIAQDWVVRPLLRSIPGVAEINSQGGFAKQYQVLVNPDKLRHFGLSIADVYLAVGRNNANAGGGVLPQYAEQYYARALKIRTLIRGDFDKAFGKIDMLLTPSTPSPAFEIGGSRGRDAGARRGRRPGRAGRCRRSRPSNRR